MSWALTLDLYVKTKDRLVMGERTVPGKLMEASNKISVPDADTHVMHYAGNREGVRRWDR